jgi:hypothetical protein
MPEQSRTDTRNDDSTFFLVLGGNERQHGFISYRCRGKVQILDDYDPFRN